MCSILGQNGEARCHSRVIIDDQGNPLTGSNPLPGGYGPAQFHTAYSLPCTPGGTTQSTCGLPGSFGPQIIAIVDAYHNPTIENDLNVFSNTYGLPNCTHANGCLTIVNQNGGTNLPKTVNGSWSLEASLDVEVAHEMCQTCKILLVEASSPTMLNLATAVNAAAKLGATAISNSYGGSEWSSETLYDSYFNHPGIAITVSSGDSGYGPEYPAASSNVVAVGGTSLQLFSDNTYASESVWNSAGSGCSLYENANSWQSSLSNWNQTGCGTKRGIADVAADADPNTGASVYDSTSYSGFKGWWLVGGTSLSSPIIASTFTLTGKAFPNSNSSSIPYTNFNLSNFHDVTTGSNGFCGTSICNGITGYDGPTGLGSPNGLAGFGGINVTPTPTPTPTPTSTPTPTPTAGPTPTPTTTPTPTPVLPTSTPTPTPTPIAGFTGQYYNNQTLSGSPTLTRIDPQINFNWGGGSPDSSIPSDHFSVSWTKTDTFSAASYQFTVTTDDGVRLYIDNNLVIDRWVDQSPTTNNTVQALSAGSHTIKMEYYENGGGAVATLNYQQVTVTPTPSPSGTSYTGDYFNNQTLSGSPILTRIDPSINFDWGSGSPDPLIPTDHFSARWTRTDTFAAGTYQFSVTADDGARLYIDNNLVIDKWIDQSPSTYTVSQSLSAGTHTIKMEYYENGGGAVAKLSISP